MPEIIKDKKTILYMVDFSCIIENEDKAIAKIKKVLEILKDAALNNGLKVIWHEQPTLTVYFSQENQRLYDEYTAIKQNYLDEGWGEYDSFEEALSNKEGYAEMYRAHIEKLVNECTAYYGDSGWVAHLFRNAQKPVMIQNYEM